MAQETLAYTVSMSFRRPVPALTGAELATGYLDDLLILSFGIADRTSHFIEIGVQEVLRGHDMCDDLVKAYSASQRSAPLA
jgi:hypothetical protein